MALLSRSLGCSFLLTLFACSAGQSDNVELEAADSAVVVAGPKRGRLVVRAQVGVIEGRQNDLLGNVTAIAVDELHRVYVADRQSHSVTVFDSSGVFVRRLGREGQGPGEFVSPLGLVWQDSQTLWVWDHGNNRYSVYDTSGVHVRDARRPAIGTDFPWPARFHDGALIEVRHGGGTYALVALDPFATLAPPLDTFSYPLSGIPLDQWNPSYWLRSATAARRTKIPFVEGVEWAFDGAGGVWVGDTREYRLLRRNLVGDVLFAVEEDLRGAAVDAKERQEAIEALGEFDPRRDLSLIPDRKPVFRSIIGTADGGAWLLREGLGNEWAADLISPEGEVMATLELDRVPDLAVLPVVHGGELWMVTRDILFDVPLVLRLGIEPH